MFAFPRGVKRRVALRPVFSFVVLHAVTCATAAYATAATSPELPVRDIFETGGKSIAAGTTYQATQFPLPIRLTAVGGGWSGAQWKANDFGPDYGWIAVAKGPTTGVPRGLIVVMTAVDKTPSVAATVAALHRGTGVAYLPQCKKKLAGFKATEFGGHTTGANHFFVPFSPASHGAAGSASDQIKVQGADHLFRFTVLNVRGKTVVVLVASPRDEWQDFLREAGAVLATVKFPS
jgi:hypothetical protein